MKILEMLEEFYSCHSQGFRALHRRRARGMTKSHRRNGGGLLLQRLPMVRRPLDTLLTRLPRPFWKSESQHGEAPLQTSPTRGGWLCCPSGTWWSTIRRATLHPPFLSFFPRSEESPKLRHPGSPFFSSRKHRWIGPASRFSSRPASSARRNIGDSTDLPPAARDLLATRRGAAHR